MPRPSPEDRIKGRLKRSGEDFLKARREFAEASAQVDSMNSAQIAKSKKALPKPKRPVLKGAV